MGKSSFKSLHKDLGSSTLCFLLVFLTNTLQTCLCFLLTTGKKLLKRKNQDPVHPATLSYGSVLHSVLIHSTLPGTQVVMVYCLLSTTVHLYISQDIISREMSQPYLKAGATVKKSKSQGFIEVHGLAEAFKPPAL